MFSLRYLECQLKKKKQFRYKNKGKYFFNYKFDNMFMFEYFYLEGFHEIDFYTLFTITNTVSNLFKAHENSYDNKNYNVL